MEHVVKTHRAQDARAVEVYLRNRKTTYVKVYEPTEHLCYSIRFWGDLNHSTIITTMQEYLWTWQHIQQNGMKDVVVNGTKLQ